MEAREVATRIAEGEPALQALLQLSREEAGKLAAHAAEPGLFQRLLPLGLAAMTRSFAQRGTGEVGPAVPRAAGMLVRREQTRRGRASGSLFGKCKVARTCDRAPGETGIFPLDAPVNLPPRCDSYVLQAWMTVCAVEHPVQARAGCFAQRFDLDVAESVLREGAQEAPQDDEAC